VRSPLEGAAAKHEKGIPILGGPSFSSAVRIALEFGLQALKLQGLKAANV
jgi:hypothetical protein